MKGLLAVAMIIGYEWLISGLVKFMRGDFPAGLANELLEKSADAPASYGSFLKSAVIPIAELFGYAIETSELLTGVALIAGPLIWHRPRQRSAGDPDRDRDDQHHFTHPAPPGENRRYAVHSITTLEEV